jgi:beta-glucosidase
MGFPKDFFWGVVDSSFQIEGAHDKDGKGLSIWDAFCRKNTKTWQGIDGRGTLTSQKGKIWRDQTGEIACDHYNRYRQNVALMKDMGIKHYNLSLSWPRILPEGTGKVNQAGLDFYDNLIDALLESGIKPYVTLFLWDYPLALYNKGGWRNRDSSDWFAEYTERVVPRLSDRIENWITMNEPQGFIGDGYLQGWHAPGEQLASFELADIAHNVLLSHGKSVLALRAAAKQKSKVGFVIALEKSLGIPASDSSADIEAARRFTFDDYGIYGNRWWTDPIMFGKYPRSSLDADGTAIPAIKDGDMEIISSPLDFYGLNIYTATTVKSDPQGQPEIVPPLPGNPMNFMEWDTIPASMYWGPKYFYEHYKIPLIIGENGMSNNDVVSLDGKVHDPQRIDYLHRYFIEMHRAIQDGVDLRGYFHWTFLDNFEWAQGHKQRFGLIYTDFVTQKRIPKDSAYWYKKVIESNGDCLAI